MSIFDYEKSVKTVFDYMENMVGGVEKMISVSADQIRSDELEKEEVMSIGKMKLFHYVPVTEKKKNVKGASAYSICACKQTVHDGSAA